MRGKKNWEKKKTRCVREGEEMRGFLQHYA